MNSYYNNNSITYNNKRYHVPYRYSNTAVNNDLVTFEIDSEQNIAKIISIQKRATNIYYGIVRNKYRDHYYVYCKELKKQTEIKIISNHSLSILQKVKFEIIQWTPFITANILKIYPNDLSYILDKYNISPTYPIQLDEDQINFNLVLEFINPFRKSYLDQTVFTIDPIDAKDFDDAISIKKTNIYTLTVHISDVSFFVRPNTLLDQEAYQRANTNYLSETVIPMLPSMLADDYCSLVEDKKRLTASVECYFDLDGNLLNYKIFRGIIKSCKRFNYDQVNKFYQGENTFTDSLNKSLIYIKELFDKIYRPSSLVKLNYISFDEDNNLICKGTGLAQNIIETFMILTNEIVAKELLIQDKQLPNRYHDKPNKQIQLVNNPIIDTINLLKTYKGAEYSATKSGHYGLELKQYCHFTSPIRRYIDLVIHRLLFENVIYSNIDEISKHCTLQQKKTNVVEEEYLNCKLYKWLDKNTNKIFEAIVIEVKLNGINCYIPELALETFISNNNKFVINEKIKLKVKTINLIYNEAEFMLS
jgi:ribonuclease R